ncbi:MAG: acyl-CoA thioesterase domain-containing protein [Actinomycetota bacterium]
MTTGYFHLGPDGFHPQPSASGPWSDQMLHGRLLGGLAARAIEADIPEGWRVGRLTVDLFRPAAMAPVAVEVHPVRMGRRLRVLDAMVTCDGHQVARAVAVILAESEGPPGRIWRPSHAEWPDPEFVPVPADADPDEPWLMRPVEGGFGTGEQTRIWTRETACVVAGEPVSPLVRAAISGDLACPLANSSDQGLHYINGDYTLALARYPVGEWVGLETAQQLAADGISMASATLFDTAGPFATSTGSSLARPPLVTDAESAPTG